MYVLHKKERILKDRSLETKYFMFFKEINMASFY